MLHVWVGYPNSLVLINILYCRSVLPQLYQTEQNYLPTVLFEAPKLTLKTIINIFLQPQRASRSWTVAKVYEAKVYDWKRDIIQLVN